MRSGPTKKSVDDLARTMSLNTGKVWLRSEGTEVLVDADKIQAGDTVVVHMGNVIPFDGLIAEGEGYGKPGFLTGESVPVRKVGRKFRIRRYGCGRG